MSCISLFFYFLGYSFGTGDVNLKLFKEHFMSNCSNFGNGSLMLDISLGRVGSYIPALSIKLIMHALCHIFNSVGYILAWAAIFLFFFMTGLLHFFKLAVLLCNAEVSSLFLLSDEALHNA